MASRGMAQAMVANAPLVRQKFAAGFSPSPGMGMAEFDAVISIAKDLLGLAPLSDEEFELALRLSTPPECRDALQ
jgi:hypothetical protein